MHRTFYKAKVLANTKGMTEDAWLKFRKLGVGGSDVGSIAGVSPWGTPLTVYMDKVEDANKTVGRSAQWGKWMEDHIAKDAAARIGAASKKINAILQHAEHPWMLANIDRLIYKPFLAIHEIKLIVSRDRAAQIKKSIEDGLPKALPEHECQVRWYMAVTGIDKAIITYEMAYGEPIDITIDRDLDMENHIISICEGFWQLVENRTPPAMDGSDAANEYLQNKFKDSTGTSIEFDPGAQFLLDQYNRSKEIIEQHEAIKDMAKQNLENLLGQNEIGRISGKQVVTWKPQDMGRFDGVQLKKDHPNIYDLYKRSNIQRVFRVTK